MVMTVGSRLFIAHSARTPMNETDDHEAIYKKASFSNSFSTSDWLFSLATSMGVFPSRFCKVLHQNVTPRVSPSQEDCKKHKISIYCRIGMAEWKTTPWWSRFCARRVGQKNAWKRNVLVTKIEISMYVNVVMIGDLHSSTVLQK